MSACTLKRFTLVVLSGVCAPLTNSLAEDVTINAVRPVAVATQKLENQFQIPITYEDPPYLFADDVEDITAQIAKPEAIVRKLASGQPVPVIKGIKARRLQFAYSPSARTSSEMEAAIRSAVDANNSSVYPPAIFEVRQAGGRFHVFPSKIKDKAGEYIVHKSLLDVPISVEPKDRDAGGFLRKFYRAVSDATQTAIGSGGMVTGLGWPRTNLGGTNVPARALLLQLFSELEGFPSARDKWSWHLLNDGNTSLFGFNLYVVRSAAPDSGNAFLSPESKVETVPSSSNQQQQAGRSGPDAPRK